MLVKEARRAPQGRFVKVITQIGDQPKTCVADQIRAQIIRKALQKRGDHERNRNHNPGIMHVQKVRHQRAQIELPSAVFQPQQNRPFGRVGPHYLVKDRLKQQSSKRVQPTHNRQQ